MTKQEIKHAIIETIHQAWNSLAGYKSIFSDGLLPKKHEFLFFIKPEITVQDETIALESIVELMLNKMEAFNFLIRDARILGAAYLQQHDIIAQHYGVINALSRKPLEYLTTEANEKFRSTFGLDTDKAPIVGSIEFLKRFPAFNPDTLDELWQKSQGVKLAGGAYCAKVTVDDETLFLVNGFHPKQLEHFTAKGRSIIAFTITGDIDWKTARENFIGKTNPADAAQGSLRNELLQKSGLLGLKAVSSSRNGFHLSAGPVEGLVELQRYCSDFSTGKVMRPENFVFGKQLSSYFNAEQVNKIMKNSAVKYNDQKISIFDLTEEKNSEEAIELLKKCSL